MPDGNGAEFISSGDPRVDAALKRLQERNEGRFKDLEDAMLVHAQLEKRASERIKEHAELIAEHPASLRRHNQWLRNFETKMSEIEVKVHFLIDREMKREGGPEAVRAKGRVRSIDRSGEARQPKDRLRIADECRLAPASLVWIRILSASNGRAHEIHFQNGVCQIARADM